MDALSILFPFFPAWQQIFLFALNLHPTTVSLGSRFLEGMLASSEFLSIVVFLHLHEVIYFSKDILLVPSEVRFLSVVLNPFVCILGSLSPHTPIIKETFIYLLFFISFI